MEICKFGYRTEETCGPIIAGSRTFLRSRTFSLPGDSGAPVYVKLGDDRVALVGVLSGSPSGSDGGTDDRTAVTALIQPVMAEEGLELR